MADRYYIYYIHKDGDGMVLTGHSPYRFTHHHGLYAWKMPLLFPTLEQVETFYEMMHDPLPDGLLDNAKGPLNIGRWLGMTPAKRNEHPDPYEWAVWRPGDR